jgi:hypothetical protein
MSQVIHIGRFADSALVIENADYFHWSPFTVRQRTQIEGNQILAGSTSAGAVAIRVGNGYGESPT